MISEVFVTALVNRVVRDGSLHCELVPMKGDAPRHNGGCPHEVSAVKHEDGFLDLICAWHADEAEKRGVAALRADQ